MPPVNSSAERWSKAEEIAFWMAVLFGAIGTVLLLIGVIGEHSSLAIISTPCFVLVGILTGVWLHFRKERREDVRANTVGTTTTTPSAGA